jgi:bacterioferritin (cytochrome b1)
MQFLSDKIVTLGGVPTITPLPVPPAETPKEMLERILEAESQAVAGYTERSEQAKAAVNLAWASSLRIWLSMKLGTTKK